jgi:hypothetical protein
MCVITAALRLPLLGSGTVGEPTYRIEQADFYDWFEQGVAVTVTAWGGCCDPVVIEKQLDP